MIRNGIVAAVAVAILAVATLAVAANAQDTATRLPLRGGPARVGQSPPARGRAQQPPPAQERLLLERQVRQGLAKVARRQLALNDDQMSQLAAVDRRFERQRRQLAQEQRQTRLTLRAAMQDTAAVDQTKVAQQLDKLLQLERKRLDLLEAEQKELATFLTPLQRAKYQALQERVRRRLEELRLGAPRADLPPR